MPVVLSDRDAEKIRTELGRQRDGIMEHVPDNAYRSQWVAMIDRLIDKLSQTTPAVSCDIDLDSAVRGGVRYE